MYYVLVLLPIPFMFSLGQLARNLCLVVQVMTYVLLLFEEMFKPAAYFLITNLKYGLGASVRFVLKKGILIKA